MSQSPEDTEKKRTAQGYSQKYLAVLSVLCLFPGVPLLVLEGNTGHVGGVLTVCGVILLSTYELTRSRVHRS